MLSTKQLKKLSDRAAEKNPATVEEVQATFLQSIARLPNITVKIIPPKNKGRKCILKAKGIVILYTNEDGRTGVEMTGDSAICATLMVGSNLLLDELLERTPEIKSLIERVNKDLSK